MYQHTLTQSYVFEGKGLHTGQVSRMTVKPAPAGFGIRFLRTDIGPDAWIIARADRVSSTARSTQLLEEDAVVNTVEHILSALTGMGIDNAQIDIDNLEVPILDGSASRYVAAFAADGRVTQEAERRYLTLSEPVEVRDEKTGSWVRVEPAGHPSYDITVDFGSKVLGVQQAKWEEGQDYASQIGVCRTFVFFHEIEYLFANNLIKGGDVDNAIVIVEHPVTEEQLDRMSASMGLPKLSVVGGGYLNNLKLHFDNECGRHKLLDLIGDMRLAGGWLNARVTAFKPGHTINNLAARAVLRQLRESGQIK